MTTDDYLWLPMTTDGYPWLQMTADGYPMTIRWLSDDYPMTIQWLSNDYPMTIWWLSQTFDLFFLMIIDLKRSLDERWLFKSGATFILRWSCYSLILCNVILVTDFTYLCKFPAYCWHQVCLQWGFATACNTTGRDLYDQVVGRSDLENIE